MLKLLRAKSIYQLPRIINPPHLILISGPPLSGKSTLGIFLFNHIKFKKNSNENIKLLSTDFVH